MSTETEQVPAVIPVPETPKAAEKMSELDRMALELAKSRKLVATAEAKTALANNDNAELNYKYVVLQLYMKYGLTEADAISENGDIHRGAAAAAAKQQAGI
jgi:hypothetical protein